MALDAKERNEIILGAVTMTGPVGDNPSEWNSQLKANAKRLSIMLSDTSEVARSLETLASCKIFSGTILHVTKEKSSSRGFIGLKTKPSKFAEDGVENVRTEITRDNPEATAFAKYLREELTGHRVLLWVEMQTFGDGAGKVRVLQHVEDLGIDPDFDAEEGKAQTLAKMKR